MSVPNRGPTVALLRTAVVSCCIALATGVAGAAPLDVATLLSAPFPYDLVASPAGEAVAWIENDRGSRNVWVASAPEWKARRLTDFIGDDGYELGAIAWSGDGRWLAFTRGGDEGEPDNEKTNPVSDPAGRAQMVWIVDLDGRHPPRSLAAGGEPAPSPRGDRLAFVAEGQLWLAPHDAKGKPAQVTKLAGRDSTPRWSPDGTRLAFVSHRRTHAFVGVLDPAAKKVLWLDPAVDSDREPTWAPDGGRIAFVRIPARSEPFAFLPRPTSEPWSIRIADAATGVGHELFRVDAGRGSTFHPPDAEAALWWTAGDRLVFPWERTGWLHLWSIAAAGGIPVDLTPGAFEVEHVALAPDHAILWVSSNQSGLDERKVWSVAADGSAPPRRATASTAVFELRPAPLAAGAVAYVESGAREPTRPMRAGGAGAVPVALRPDALPAAYPSAALVEPLDVVFPSTDGLAIHGQLFLPEGGAAGERHPAVVFVHGGPVRQMLAGFHYMGYYWQAYAVNQALASRGFVVLSINYRAGIGYGLDFREAPGIGEAGASEFQDVLAGALFLKGRSEVDAARIGIWGGSYGGYLTALALARASNVFEAGVDFHGVHDWNVEFPNPPFTRDYAATGDRLWRSFRASPLADVASWRSPVLLIQGDDDHNVPFEETVRMVEALRKQGVPCEQLVFPDEVHDFLLRATWLRAYGATIDFLERQLR